MMQVPSQRIVTSVEPTPAGCILHKDGIKCNTDASRMDIGSSPAIGIICTGSTGKIIKTIGKQLGYYHILTFETLDSGSRQDFSPDRNIQYIVKSNSQVSTT